jgi:transposase InsO family protein
MLDVAKSSYYDYLRQKKQKAQRHKRKKPGPKVQVDDKMLLQSILEVMTASPFVTEGVKKVHARLRRKGIKASRNRVNLIMRAHGLLSPQRHEQGEEKKHEGTIIPDSINQIWGTDGTLFGTVNGDLLWLFAVMDHHSDEVLGWHIVEVGQGDRFAALEPIKPGLRRILGCVGKDVGDGIAIRHDGGPQYIARDIVGRWMETYNNQWLIERHGKCGKRAKNLNPRLLDRLYWMCMLDLSGETRISSAQVQLVEG